MRRNLRRRIFALSSKIAILGLLSALTFSPFGQLFSPPEVHAEQACGKIMPGGVGGATMYDRNDIKPAVGGECPDGYGFFETTPPGTTDTNACNSLPSCIAEVVYWFTAGLGGATAYLAAWVLSIATALSLSSTAYALDFITEGWTLVRDLANMLFVLILVYLALTIMFKAETNDTAKKLAWVIVIALVINFSFFFTRVVIDAGNLLAVQFYNYIPARSIGETMKMTDLPGSEITTLTGEGGATKDLTFSIMEGVGIQKIMSNTAFNAFQERNSGMSGFVAELLLLLFIYITVGAMFFMLAAAFFTVAVMFIIRIAVLWLLIIASPLAFVANTLQEGKHWYKQWQSALISHAFFPAFFLFVFYILTLFMANLTGGDPNNSIISQAFGATDPTAASDSYTYIISVMASVIVRMGFVLALLYIGLKASTAMGAMGANFANNLGKRVTSFTGGLPLRGALAGTGMIGRNTIGAGGNAIDRSAKLRTLDEKGGLKGLFARGLRTAGASVSNKTFDARNAPGAASAFGVGGLIDVGKGQKGGYLTRLKASTKAKVDYAKGLGPNDAEKQRAQEKADGELDYVATKAGMEGTLTQEKRELAELDDKIAKMKSSGAGETEELRRAKRERDSRATFIENTENSIKDFDARRNSRIKELSGDGLTKKFAEENLLSPGALMSAGNPGFVTRASRQAAAELLKKKGGKDLAAEAIKALQAEDGGGEPTPPAGGGGGSKGSGSGGGGSTTAAGGSTTGKSGSGTHASMEEHTEKMVTATERMAQRLERTLEKGFHGIGEQLHEQSKHVESQTLKANSQKINNAQAATKPVAAVPVGAKVAVPPKPPTETRLNTPPQMPVKPASANDNLPPNISKAA